MLLSRRKFLQASLGSSALVGFGSSVPDFLARTAHAAAGTQHSGEPVLVVLQLSGGNDGLNTVVPYGDPAYEANRIVLRIPAGQVLRIDDRIGLHPSLRGFSKLLEDRHLAILQGVGYPNPDRSHFRSMDIWHSARPEVPASSDGWLGRSVERLPHAPGDDVPALHLGAGELPLALVSERRAVPSIESLESFHLNTARGALPVEVLQQLAAVKREADNPLVSFIQRSTLNAYTSSRQVQESLAEERSAEDYPGFGLARKLRGIAQLIDAGLKTRIYYVSLDGFDTHGNQLPGHAALLNELSESLSAFVGDLKARGHLDRVLVMMFSEFGRRVRENASQGTDHGAAAPLFLAGGRVKAGLLGDHPSLTELDPEGDLKFHTDFRQIYATLLDRWLACSSEAVLGSRFDHVPILQS